jgi:phospholipid-binding lipoprotein MlaA
MSERLSILVISLCLVFTSSYSAAQSEIPQDTYAWINYLQEQRQVDLKLNEWVATPNDPYQSFNRKAFDFNQSIDNLILKPLAKGYTQLPRPIRTGTHNFFSNLSEPLNLINCLLQAKGTCASNSFFRFVFNSTFGLFGLLDVATEMGIKEQDEDFGQTLVHWGMAPGHYLVLPFLGPSSTTDGLGNLVDLSMDTTQFAKNDEQSYGLFAVKLIDKRAGLLSVTEFMEEQKVDQYTFMRESYLQLRNNAYFDGHPPTTNSLDDFNLDASDLNLKLN